MKICRFVIGDGGIRQGFEQVLINEHPATVRSNKVRDKIVTQAII